MQPIRVNDYDFNLITVMILDGFQEGIPVAWALSNREDKCVLLHILHSVKEKSGPINPQWFMSDMALQYYNAWKEVFTENNTKYLWCAWHVNRAWRDGIKRHFNLIDNQRAVYYQLHVLMMETDKASFRKLLTQFLTLSSSTSPTFTDYFRNIYCSHVEQWAMCHRVGTPMNTNMYSESFHRVLKIVYLRHKHNRRIDFLIYILVTIARDKAFEQLQKLEKGKHSHRICDINKRHKRAVQYVVLATVNNTEPNLYTVSSESTERFYYTVKRKQLSCECKIWCQFCSVYACTCLDACTNTTVCKHMHLVHMHEETKDDDSSKTDTAAADLEYYRRVTLPTVTSTSTSRNTLVKNIKERITHLLSKCNNCYDINVLENTYTNLGTVLNNFNSPNNNYSSRIKKNKVSHLNSTTQQKFYSTQKI